MDYDAKARDEAVAAIGRPIRVRFNPKTSVLGVVHKCLFVCWIRVGERQHAKYHIVVRAGVGQMYEHEFNVLELPNRAASDQNVPEIRACEFQENPPEPTY
jgi:hypothetical protein